jgi:hypothetical protein
MVDGFDADDPQLVIDLVDDPKVTPSSASLADEL